MHTDIWLLDNILSREERYFITFIDDHSISTKFIYFSEAQEKFNIYQLEVENQLNKKNKVLR